MGVDTEPPGKPYGSTVATPPVIKPGGACVLDAIATSPDGMTRRQVAAIMGERHERVRQVEIRALAKLRCARLLVDALEAVRPELPPGAELVVAYPASLDPLAIHLHVSVRVPPVPSPEQAGLPVRRRRKP